MTNLSETNPAICNSWTMRGLARNVPCYRLTYPDFEGVLGTISGLLDEY